MKRRGLRSLAWAALEDLFDQSTAFGRLALVHVVMMAGDALVGVSLAGSLFFSVSPHEAKSKVVAYLALTVAPFAVVSPLLGPLIDRTATGRRWLVASSSALRAVVSVVMMRHLQSWLLFPEAFSMLVLSKLYAVTRGTLVPEMARADQMGQLPPDVDAAGWPVSREDTTPGFAGFNAQLTLLGTVAGLVLGSIGAAVLKTLGAPDVLAIAAACFAGATACAVRLPRQRVSPTTDDALTDDQLDLAILNPYGSDAVRWGLGVLLLVRCMVGLTSFAFVFALRRHHASIGWYGVVVLASGVGSLVGLALIARLRGRLNDSTLLALALALIAASGGAVSQVPSIGTQVCISVAVAIAAAIAQPSFDSISQSCVPAGLQGRTFARFAVRQQLAWVAGAIVPVLVTMSLARADALVGVASLAVLVVYLLGQPRDVRPLSA